MTERETLIAALEQLIVRWRNEAHDLREATHGQWVEPGVVESCADELEEVLTRPLASGGASPQETEQAAREDRSTAGASPAGSTASSAGGYEHKLKILPEYFEAIIDGSKTFEVRRNDRDYAVGDVLWLCEYTGTLDGFTGRECRRRVTYLTQWEQKPGYVVMGLSPAAREAQALDAGPLVSDGEHKEQLSPDHAQEKTEPR